MRHALIEFIGLTHIKNSLFIITSQPSLSSKILLFDHITPASLKDKFVCQFLPWIIIGLLSFTLSYQTQDPIRRHLNLVIVLLHADL